jgi:hypothetical protein
MNYLIPAQLAAQLLSLFVFATMAVWYAVPNLNARGRVEALVPCSGCMSSASSLSKHFGRRRTDFPSRMRT